MKQPRGWVKPYLHWDLTKAKEISVKSGFAKAPLYRGFVRSPGVFANSIYDLCEAAIL